MHQKKYSKGLDVGSKSEQTQFQYKDLLKDQRTLDSLGFLFMKKSQLEEKKESDQVHRLDQ